MNSLNKPWQDTATVGKVMAEAVRQMNQHINQHGRIERSSQVIKNWHDYDNDVWLCILAGAQILQDEANLRLPGYAEDDIELLAKHIEDYGSHHSNILYPTPKDTKHMGDALTHNNPQKHSRTIKQRTYRLMMNIRDRLCGDDKSIGVLAMDFPNSDSSKGKLDPTPKETLLSVQQ